MNDHHDRDEECAVSQISEIASASLKTAITTFEGDVLLTHQFVNGGTNATVTVASGTYPTLPNVIATAQTSISTQVQALLTTAQTTVNTAINALNTGRFNESFAANAGTPVLVQHNLNTGSYLAFIMVQGTDGIYRNGADPILIEEVDPSNSFNVTLQVTATFKVSVIANAALT